MVASAKVAVVIEARSISLSLGGQSVLRDVSLQLKPGQITALCGPNGAGKSTLLAALAGEHPGCASGVDYFGQPLSHIPALKLARHRVVLEQNPSLAADFTVSELLELGVPLDLAPEDLNLLKARLIDELGFSDLTTRYVKELSGGQQHRAHFARILVQLQANLHLGHGCFLLLDEPTASLDVGHQVSLLERVRALGKRDVGVLLVLHDLNLAAAYANTVVLMKDGRILYEGAPKKVLTSDNLSALYDADIMVETAPNGQKIIQPVLA